MNQENEKKIKWIDGRMVQGAYRQWLVDEHPEALEIKALDIITRHTLGWRIRYGYIREELFGMSHSTKWRQIKKLKELGLLEYKRTRKLTYYKLYLPEDIEDNTQWLKKIYTQKSEKKIPKQEPLTGSGWK